MPTTDHATTPTADGHVGSTDEFGPLVEVLARWEDENGTMACILPNEWSDLRQAVMDACVHQSPRMLRAEIRRLRTALAELVAVKDLKERTEALHFAGPLSAAGESWGDEYEAGRKEYLHRQPAAWDAARAALGPNTGAMGREAST